MVNMTKQSWTACLNAEQAAILAAFIQTGRVAHLYPRRRTITCNGFPPMTIPHAVAYMRGVLAKLEGGQ